MMERMFSTAFLKAISSHKSEFFNCMQTRYQNHLWTDVFRQNPDSHFLYLCCRRHSSSFHASSGIKLALCRNFCGLVLISLQSNSVTVDGPRDANLSHGRVLCDLPPQAMQLHSKPMMARGHKPKI